MNYPYHPPVEGAIPIVAEGWIPDNLQIQSGDKKEKDVEAIFLKLKACGFNTAMLGGGDTYIQCVLQDVLLTMKENFPFFIEDELLVCNAFLFDLHNK